MGGALRRYLRKWDPRALASPSLAQSNLSEWISEIIDRYVPLVEPSAKTEAPWWNYHCNKAYKFKQRVFLVDGADSVKYKRAVDWNKIVQRRAFKTFNRKLRARLQKMGTSDRNFWDIIKEIGGLEKSRSSAAPDAEDLAEHFAKKMTSGRDRVDDGFS